MTKAVAIAEVQQRLVGERYDVQGSTPEEFATLVKADVAKYSKVIRDAGIKVN